MILFKILILATIGALIGWLTNIIAIKLIFRPLNPVKMPLFNIYFQGLIPKRRGEIAKSIGEVIESELLSIKDIIDKFVEEEDFTKIKNLINIKLQEIIDSKLPPIIPSAFKKSIYKYIDDTLDSEGDKFIKDIIDNMIDRAIEKVSLSDMVEEKINEFELDKIEEIVIAIAKQELKHIEVLGGILGFLIGLIQGGIILIF